jgi:hypothetical protein
VPKQCERPQVSIEPVTANSVRVIIGDISVFAVMCDEPIYEVTANGKPVRIKP